MFEGALKLNKSRSLVTVFAIIMWLPLLKIFFVSCLRVKIKQKNRTLVVVTQHGKKEHLEVGHKGEVVS